MKNLSYTLAFIIAGTLGLATVTQARDHGQLSGHDRGTTQHRIEKRIDRRQARQWARVKDGIDSGAISRGEAKRLLKKQRKIARLERRFERDGYYSPRERRIMERALNRSSALIKRAKHNDWGRSSGGRHHGWRRDLHRYGVGRYAYEEPEATYGFNSRWSESER
ncbi:MAG: hypothetical protein WBR56_08435 [Sedimenticolaceae bacterium]